MKKICLILAAIMIVGSISFCGALANDNTNATPPEYENATVITSYTSAYGKKQGENNFYFCEYRDGMVTELTFDSSNRWSNGGTFPLYSLDGSTTPANTADSNLKFISPMKGTVRLKGKVGFSQWRKPGEGGNGIVVSIVKNKKVLWTATVPEAGSVNYDISTSVKIGDELHFRVNAKDKNNGWDTAMWWPRVDYIGVEYVPDLGDNLYFQKNGETLTQLEYNEEADCYFADDGLAFISDKEVMPTKEYSLVKRFTIKEKARYRVNGSLLTDDENSNGIILSVYKNGKTVWKQLITENDEGIFDVRMAAERDDTIDVELSVNKYEGFNLAKLSCDVSAYKGTLFCNASTSQRHTFGTEEVYTLSSFIKSTQDDDAKYYALQYDVKHPLTYNSASKTWEDKWEGHAFDDKGYISATTVNPGHLADICVDITLPETGMIKLDGSLPVSSAGDGMLTKIYLNGRLLWSSRVGGERFVRWDEEFDTSYFNNNINAVSAVNKGDILTFRFGRWQTNSYDATSIENIVFSYIKGAVLSKTTKWKLENSIVADTKTGAVYVNRQRQDFGVKVFDGTTYIEKSGGAELFGDAAETEEIKTISGTQYVQLRKIAEESDKTVEWTADRIVLIYDGIPVLFSWPEFCEIETTLKQGGGLFD